MGLPCRTYRGYAVAVHRRLCYPHVTSAAVVYGGWGYWTNWQGSASLGPGLRKTLRLLQDMSFHYRHWDRSRQVNLQRQGVEYRLAEGRHQREEAAGRGRPRTRPLRPGAAHSVPARLPKFKLTST